MAQTSTKRKNIIIASIVIVVLVVSSIATLIIFYQPSKAKHKSTLLNLSISANQTNVLQGNSLQAKVNVTSIGNPENVILGGDVGSSDINCTFEPSMGTSNFTSALTMNVPNSTPTGNYTLILTALGDGEMANASYVISVLSANVTVSGTVTISAPGISSLSQIQFTDTQTDSTLAYSFPSSFPPVATNDFGTYSVTLQNEHTYNITLVYFWGLMSVGKYTADDGNFTVFAPAGSTSISQDFSLD